MMPKVKEVMCKDIPNGAMGIFCPLAELLELLGYWILIGLAWGYVVYIEVCCLEFFSKKDLLPICRNVVNR